MAQWYRIHLPIQEMRVQSLGLEIPGEGNGNPLQYSCLEKIPPMDRGAWVGYSAWAFKELDTTED